MRWSAAPRTHRDVLGDEEEGDAGGGFGGVALLAASLGARGGVPIGELDRGGE